MYVCLFVFLMYLLFLSPLYLKLISPWKSQLVWLVWKGTRGRGCGFVSVGPEEESTSGARHSERTGPPSLRKPVPRRENIGLYAQQLPATRKTSKESLLQGFHLPKPLRASVSFQKCRQLPGTKPCFQIQVSLLFRYDRTDRSVNSCHWKDILSCSHPERRSHLTQGQARGEAPGSATRQRGRGKLWQEPWLWFPWERIVRLVWNVSVDSRAQGLS